MCFRFLAASSAATAPTNKRPPSGRDAIHYTTATMLLALHLVGNGYERARAYKIDMKHKHEFLEIQGCSLSRSLIHLRCHPSSQSASQPYNVQPFELLLLLLLLMLMANHGIAPFGDLEPVRASEKRLRTILEAVTATDTRVKLIFVPSM